MRLPPLLLHVLLSLALVANGIGTAMASLKTGCAHSEAAAAATVEAPPCHDDMSSTAASDDAVPAPAATTDHEGCDDCSGHCDCGGCVAHSQAALIPPTLLLPVSERIAHLAAHVHARATPALPHPVRPPIG